MSCRAAVVACILLPIVGDARRSSATNLKGGNVEATERIVPELEPKSDNKFMHDDYPSDQRPAADGMRFEHPYPVVQESADYDADYVKDENDDNGQWKAQMDYDAMRVKYRKEKQEMLEAKKIMDKEKQELEKAKELEQIAEDKAEEAEAAADKARGEAEIAENKYQDARAATAGASEKVDQELTDLEECKKELAEAKRKLQELLDARPSGHGSASAHGGGYDDISDKVAEAQAKEEQHEKIVADEQAEHMAALKHLKEQEALMKDIKERMKMAEERVRKYRRDPEYVDPDGGVYRHTTPKPKVKSGASQKTSWAAALALSLLVASFAY